MQTQEFTKEVNVNGEKFIFKTGKLAPRAESSVLAQVGETTVLTVVSMNEKDSELDYFPLTVEYIEKFYAGGRISSSKFQKREGRPSDEAVLKGRQIDHSIRSLFPKGFKKDVNVIVTVLSYDEEHDPTTLAVTSASLALMLSSIPFMGPSSSVKMGIVGDKFITNPLVEQELDSEFIVSVRHGRILNIEGYGSEVSEEKMGELLDKAVEYVKPLLDMQVEFAKEHGKEKMDYQELPAPVELIEKVTTEYYDRVKDNLYNSEKRQTLMQELKNEIAEGYSEDDENAPSAYDIDTAVEYVARKIMRENVLKENKRTSGRELNEFRDLEIDVNVLPRVHGSALFRRGLTQALTITTLASPKQAQVVETFEGDFEKDFFHHYNGPSYSLGEAGRFAYYPGRREIGHGTIAENALKKILPGKEEFPYTIRVVSEILSQKGSSSMAATCGTSLSLMSAGVPIKAQVGGISVGLITNDEDVNDYKLLTDIEDVEDFYGDMDFKVTGTTKGVTAIQLDNKLMGVPVDILKKAFVVSREARLKIIEAMNAVIDKPAKELSKYAPRIISFMVDASKIGEIIGPSGKTIKSIIEKAGGNVEIDIDDTGKVNITSNDANASKIAEEAIRDLSFEAKVGGIYTGVVDKITPYGAFVELKGHTSGLLHVSEMSDKFVKDPNLIVKEGQKIKVKVDKIDSTNGKISFTIKGIAQDDAIKENN